MSKESIVFSVITITYNAEDNVECTLKSVAEQTYPYIEYIIIDGASKDNTLAIVSRYQNKVSKLLSERDKGLYDAMNKGIQQATGDYLCFLNAGDTFHSCNTLKEIVDGLPNDALPDVIYGETALVDENRNFLRMRRLSAPEKLNWKSFQNGMLVCHQSFIPKRTLVPLYDLKYRFSSDFDWCIKIMKQSKQLYNTHLTLIDYLSEGMTTKHRKASLIERYHIMCKYYGTLPTICKHIGFVFRLLIKH